MLWPTHLQEENFPFKYWEGMKILCNSLAYNAVPLIAAFAAKLFASALFPCLLSFALTSTCTFAILQVYRQFCHRFVNLRNCQFENFTLRCYDTAQKYYYLRFIAAVIVCAVSLVLPGLGFALAIPLGLFYGTVVEIDLQRWRQSSVN